MSVRSLILLFCACLYFPFALVNVCHVGLRSSKLQSLPFWDHTDLSRAEVNFYDIHYTHSSLTRHLVWIYMHQQVKVGVNHGCFHIYHFWHFLIFKCMWVCSSSSSKNKNIFLNLFINSINLKLSIYLSISKMCSSLFSRGNQACARIANAKRTTQSWDAALSAIYIEGTRLTFELARGPWQPVRFFENNSEIHDICWGIMDTYFLILWMLPSGFGWNWCQNWRFVLSTMCANDRNFRVSTRPLRPFSVLFVTTFEQKHRFLRVHFEAVITIFWTIWTIYCAT